MSVVAGAIVHHRLTSPYILRERRLHRNLPMLSIAGWPGCSNPAASLHHYLDSGRSAGCRPSGLACCYERSVLLTIDFQHASGKRGIGHSKVHMYAFHYLGALLYNNVCMNMPTKQGLYTDCQSRHESIKSMPKWRCLKIWSVPVTLARNQYGPHGIQ